MRSACIYSGYRGKLRSSQAVLVAKNLPANTGDARNMGLLPGSGRPLEEGVATHSNILAWRIPVDRGVRGGYIHRVTKRQTRLKRFRTTRNWPRVCSGQFVTGGSWNFYRARKSAPAMSNGPLEQTLMTRLWEIRTKGSTYLPLQAGGHWGGSLECNVSASWLRVWLAGWPAFTSMRRQLWTREETRILSLKDPLLVLTMLLEVNMIPSCSCIIIWEE